MAVLFKVKIHEKKRKQIKILSRVVPATMTLQIVRYQHPSVHPGEGAMHLSRSFPHPAPAEQPGRSFLVMRLSSGHPYI